MSCGDYVIGSGPGLISASPSATNKWMVSFVVDYANFNSPPVAGSIIDISILASGVTVKTFSLPAGAMDDGISKQLLLTDGFDISAYLPALSVEIGARGGSPPYNGTPGVTYATDQKFLGIDIAPSMSGGVNYPNKLYIQDQSNNPASLPANQCMYLGYFGSNQGINPPVAEAFESGVSPSATLDGVTLDTANLATQHTFSGDTVSVAEPAANTYFNYFIVLANTTPPGPPTTTSFGKTSAIFSVPFCMRNKRIRK